MTTTTLVQALTYTLQIPAVAHHIQKLEELPNRFIIDDVIARVINIPQNIIRVWINYREAGNPNLYKEDVLVDIQGTSLADFKVLQVAAYEFKP